MRIFNQIAAAAAILVLTAVSANAAAPQKSLLKNGSFGGKPPPDGCVSGTDSLLNWTVTTGSIDILSDSSTCGPIAPPVGVYFLNLTGGADTGAATINQTVATTVGTLYILTFNFGGDPEWQTGCFGSGNTNDGPTKSMNVLISGSVGVTANYTIDTTGLACDDPGWTFEGIFFTATTATTTISFQSLDTTGVYGPLLAGAKLVATNSTATGLVEQD